MDRMIYRHIDFSGKPTFHYTGLDVLSKPPEKRPKYCKFEVRYGDSLVLSIYTNNYLMGLYVECEDVNVGVAQFASSEQFYIPTSILGAKARLRKLALRVIKAKNEHDMRELDKRNRIAILRILFGMERG